VEEAAVTRRTLDSKASPATRARKVLSTPPEKAITAEWYPDIICFSFESLSDIF
jgi:hypothetical protein